MYAVGDDTRFSSAARTSCYKFCMLFNGTEGLNTLERKLVRKAQHRKALANHYVVLSTCALTLSENGALCLGRVGNGIFIGLIKGKTLNNNYS